MADAPSEDVTTAPETVNLDDALATIDEHWHPRVAATANDHTLKIAVVEGEFVEHSHPDADEVFLVLAGDLSIEFSDRADVRLGDGDLTVVPAGVPHRPVAHEETRLLLVEPRDTRNTGDKETEHTVDPDPVTED